MDKLVFCHLKRDVIFKIKWSAEATVFENRLKSLIFMPFGKSASLGFHVNFYQVIFKYFETLKAEFFQVSKATSKAVSASKKELLPMGEHEYDPGVQLR